MRSSVSIVPTPVVDFKKPSTVHSSTSAAGFGLACFPNALLISAAAAMQSVLLPADKIRRAPTCAHPTAGMLSLPAQTSIRLFTMPACSSHGSPARAATYSVPPNAYASIWLSNNVVVVVVPV